MPEKNILAPALAWSGALRRTLHTDDAFSAWLQTAATQAVSRYTIHHWYEELTQAAAYEAAPRTSQETVASTLIRQVLRRLRERVFYTVMVRDIQGSASLLEVVSAMTALADLAIAELYRAIANELAQRHGIPKDPVTAQPQEMLIVGMGKLGGRELNVSSDVDLILLYASEGTTQGPRPISHHEFYQRVTRQLASALSEHDAWGYIFRCDLRLRPDGDAGPLAWSLPALKNYLQTQGREWERYAWLKARVIPAQAFEGSDARAHVQAFEAIRQPFVYRKYSDFDALASLRAVRERIRQDWDQRARQRNGVDTAHNIKLGEGGIREIEFIVQLNQLIRGGRLPSLQQKGLHPALYKQRKAGLLPHDLAQGLEEAYFFLRRLEHMLQYREDAQTHLLPQDTGVRQALATAMGYGANDFEEQLAAHRRFVSHAFRNAFRLISMTENETSDAHSERDNTSSDDSAPHDAYTAFGTDAERVRQHTERLLQSHRIRTLPSLSQQRLSQLVPTALHLAAQQLTPTATALRLLNLIEQIASRSSYLALFSEYPNTLERVAQLVAASPWAAQYLTQHPVLLDNLIEWKALLNVPDFDQLARQLSAELDACILPNGQADIEQQMNLMRDLQHQVSFQLLAQDLGQLLSVEELADHLSALADMLLEETIQRVWPLVHEQSALRSPTAASQRTTLARPRFAVIAYGKLGGKELGYASDLDLVFLYDEEDPNAAEPYLRLARRIISWLSTLTSSGRLYEIDLRLRPDGDAGLLAVSFSAFEQYQHQHAWSWEHQALTRARFCAGDPALGTRFEALRTRILLNERDVSSLQNDVGAMRKRIAEGHPNRSGNFDIKHDPGGMVDVEFIVQYLVLAHAHQHRALLGNLGNIALLRLAAESNLIPADLSEEVASAYRSFRRRQHTLRLQGAEHARVAHTELSKEREAVVELWNLVLGD